MSSDTTNTPPREGGDAHAQGMSATEGWPKSAVRVIFGVIWLIDAYLKWQPAFRSQYLDMIQGGAKGQPAWLAPWFTFVINFVSLNPIAFGYATAVIESLIALALILGFARKLTYILAALFAFAIWATAEGFGGPYTAGATDVGAAIIYVIVFLALLSFNYHLGASRYSADYFIEKRVRWWWVVAEVRRPKKAQ